MPWSRKLTQPIILKDGRTITNLGEAREVMIANRALLRRKALWRVASEVLQGAAEDKVSLGDAVELFERALKAEGLI
jgi:hypothetical protein